MTPITNRPVGVADFVNPTVIPTEPILGAPGGPAVPDAWRQQGPPAWPQYAPGQNIMTAPRVVRSESAIQGPPYVAPPLEVGSVADSDFWNRMVPEQLDHGTFAPSTDGQAATGFGPSWTGAFPDVDIAGSIADHARMYYEYAYGQVDEEFDLQLGRLNEDYGEQISALQEIMNDYKQGRIDANTAYDEYQVRSAAILQAAITVPADPIQSAVEDAVQETYARAGGAVAEVASLIDAGGDAERFGQAMGEITAFQDAMVEGLRHDLVSIEEVQHATAEVSRALAKHAYADDAYKSEYAQEELTIQITSAIDKQAKEIEKAQAAWDKAKARMAEDRARASANIPDYEIDEEYFRSVAFKEWAAAMGLDDEQMAAVQAKGLEAWAAAGGNASEYLKEITQTINEYNMGAKGVLEDWLSLTDLVRGEDPLLASQMDELLRGRDFAASNSDFMGLAAKAIVAIVAVTEPGEEPFPGFDGWRVDLFKGLSVSPDDPLWFSGDPIVQALKNYSAFESDFAEEMAEERRKEEERARAKYHTGSQAPNNYVNRNTADYTYRRDTVVPWAARLFNAEFDHSGKNNVGGVYGSLKGMMRENDGRGAKNSDHLSGGAMDLYGDSEAERVAIAAWARSQPWASLVIYEGNKDHEGHHVHVSVQIGWRIP
ncbi:MAG: hypothetical protein M3094_08655 [Actinomycetia bacterium]|nr:hypothetical protein [Actinomycetes bacterium]